MLRLALLLLPALLAGSALPVGSSLLVRSAVPLAAAHDVPAVGPAAIEVVTSISPLADLIGNVGGDLVAIATLVPPGGEPETYDPTPADAAAVGRASVFFANGLGLERYLERLPQSAGRPDLEVVTLSDRLPTLTSFGQGADEGGNPHLWLDPRNAIQYVEVIRATLSRIDPDHADAYAANAARYTAQLEELDAAIEQQVQTIPPDQRVLVTTHDSLPYFARRYGLTYLAVVSANPEADPSAREYADLVAVVRERQVKAIFGEAGFSERFVSQLAADTGSAFVADLYTDTLSQDPPTNTYLGAMQHTANAIVASLR
ncbi:MAG: zinc ABC transporter substrate-binding protein [Chloroflexi bacterium]|nr:zinc ABC transporter substrate-binding protein [Chloroflexota bacterium]